VRFEIAIMRVLELVIDGFKSYAVRTVISGWDEAFNSITGLNGSGKSNILDSICFVLGITNMSTVRAQNLQVRGDEKRELRLTANFCCQ
jgi:structural maintenance of chromosome 2